MPDILKNGAITALAAALINLLLQTVYHAVFDIDPGFSPLTTPFVAIFTVTGVIGAIVAFTLINERAKQPARTFRMVAGLVLLVSFIPNVLMALNPSFVGYPGAGPLTAALLGSLHLAPAILSMVLLPRPTGGEAAAKEAERGSQPPPQRS